jgi:hypothetical protein
MLVTPGGVAGADDGGTVQLHRCLVRAEQVGGWFGSGWPPRGATWRVGQCPDRELDIAPKSGVQVFGNRDCRGGQRDLIRRRLTFWAARIGKPLQVIRLLVT